MLVLMLIRSIYRTSEKGTDAAEWDRVTWYHLRDLARNHPEAGIHFQSTFLLLLLTQWLSISVCVSVCRIYPNSKLACKTYTRTKDLDSPNPKFPLNPWWKDMLPDVGFISPAYLLIS